MSINEKKEFRSDRIECLIAELRGMSDTLSLLSGCSLLHDTLIDTSLAFLSYCLEHMQEEAEEAFEFVFGLETQISKLRKEEEVCEVIRIHLPVLSHLLK